MREAAISIVKFITMALGLKDTQISESFREGLYDIRMNCYPPCPEPERVLGIVPHADNFGITLLLDSGDFPGLQFLKDEKWVDVEPIEGAIVANIGHIIEIPIAFPDDGAWKQFHMQLQHFPTIVCAKVRERDQRIVRIKEGEPKGRHVVIVDDLVQSVGTLIEWQKVLAAQGVSKISAYVTHGIFPNKSWARFGHDNGGHPESAFTYFWITDSCPLTVKEVMNRPPFEVLSLASSISASLQI